MWPCCALADYCSARLPAPLHAPAPPAPHPTPSHPTHPLHPLPPTQVLPEAPAELVVELSRRYILLYEKITGQQFVPAPLDQSPAQRMAANISKALEAL